MDSNLTARWACSFASASALDQAGVKACGLRALQNDRTQARSASKRSSVCRRSVDDDVEAARASTFEGGRVIVHFRICAARRIKKHIRHR